MKAISKEATKTLEKLIQGMDKDNSHKSIKNDPYQRLVIEIIGEVKGVGSTGKGQLVSLAHYPEVDFGEDPLVDPEVCFIRCITGVMNKKTFEVTDEVQYYPYYIKYVTGKEFEYVRFEDDDFSHAKLFNYAGFTQAGLASFVNIWCRNIKEQGFLRCIKMSRISEALEDYKLPKNCHDCKRPLKEAGKDGKLTKWVCAKCKREYFYMD